MAFLFLLSELLVLAVPLLAKHFHTHLPFSSQEHINIFMNNEKPQIPLPHLKTWNPLHGSLSQRSLQESLRDRRSSCSLDQCYTPHLCTLLEEMVTQKRRYSDPEIKARRKRTGLARTNLLMMQCQSQL